MPLRAAPLHSPRRGLRWLSAETTLNALAAAISLIIALPLISIAVLALAPARGVWSHLISTTLPYSIRETLLLMSGVAVLTLLAGAGTAWLVTMYRFPGRGLFDWLLVLPLALPTYITAYCYGEFLDYTGPAQTLLRHLAGFKSYGDYWFPNVRSLGGAIFVLSAVLYPYVYLTARASFALQSIHVLEVARTLGRTSFQTLFSVALPMARPALIAGVSLALMECLNDIGAVDYLGVQTLTLSVYAAWLQRSSLSGAAQLALLMFVFVIALLTLERFGRRDRRFETARADRPVPEHQLGGLKGGFAALACAVPLIAGFLIPVGMLVEAAATHGAQNGFEYARAAGHSFLLAAIAAAMTVALAVVLGAALRLAGGRVVPKIVRVSSFGYAIPGTVIALGLILPLGAFDNALSAFAVSHFGVNTGLVLSGSAFALLLAYTIRFMAVALGPVEAGLQRLSRNLDAAARSLGTRPLAMFASVHVPLLTPAIGAAALLVFVDAMKELSATLLLRPFNFETLATHIYTYASQEQFERSALAALTIVVVGLIPLLLTQRALRIMQRRHMSPTGHSAAEEST